MRNRLIIFSGQSNPPLTQKVCSSLGLDPGKALIGRFSDGEIRVELSQNVRGMDVYVLQPTCPPVNDNLMELIVITDALKRASARRINAIIPYYGYGRQEQKDKPRVAITARMVADLLSVAGVSRVITIDFHAEQVQGFFDIPVEHLYGLDVFLDDVRRDLQGNEIIVAPDANGVDRAAAFAGRLKIALAIMDHRRSLDAPFSSIVGDVRGRRVIILDDIVDTGKTIIRTAESAQSAGAESVHAYCVHAILSGDAVRRLKASPLSSLTVTDTVPLSEEAVHSGFIQTVSIAPMLAEVVRRVHFEESVSSLFPRK